MGASWVDATITSRQVGIADPATHCANEGHTVTSAGVELGIGGAVRNTLLVGGWVSVP